MKEGAKSMKLDVAVLGGQLGGEHHSATSHRGVYDLGVMLMNGLESPNGC